MKPIAIYHYDAAGELTGSTVLPVDSVRVLFDLFVTSALLVGRETRPAQSGLNHPIAEALDAADDVIDSIEDSSS